MYQLSFDMPELPELDKRKTKYNLESVFDRYRIFKAATFQRREATITQSYEAPESQRTNVTSDQTASIATYNVDQQQMRLEYCKVIEQAVEQLEAEEQFLLTERYLKHRRAQDIIVYQQRFDPPISPSTYDEIRWCAFQKISLYLCDVGILKIEQIKKDG